MNRYIAIPLCCLLFLAVSVSFAQNNWLELHGTTQNGTTKLFWSVKGWPDDLQGFNIKKRDQSGRFSGNWQSLNTTTLRPQLTSNRDWSELGLNSNQQSAVQAKTSQYFDQQGMSQTDAETVLQIMKENDGPGTGDRIKMKADFDFALITGFAFVDNNYNSRRGSQYGIFFVDEDGTERTTPVDIYIPQDRTTLNQMAQTALSFDKLKEGVALNWKLSKTALADLEIHGFNIFRSQNGGGDPEVIYPHPLGQFKEDADFVYWQYIDKTAENNNDYAYAVAAVDMFQQAYPQSSANYDAEMYVKVAPAELNELQLHEDVHVAINWQLSENESNGRVQGYILERMMAGEQALQPITTSLPPGTSTFIDTDPKAYGNVYIYRLLTVDSYGEIYPSSERSLYYMGLVEPPPVTGLSASVIEEENRTYVELKWDEKSATDVLTKGYTLYTDELIPGEFLQQASTPLITANRYRHEIKTSGGKSYNFRIVSLSIHNAEGEPTEVSVFVDYKEIPKPRGIDVQFRADRTVLVSWTYADLDRLQGFELFMNGEKIAGTDRLSADRRSYVVQEPEASENGLAVFGLRAVSSTKSSKMSMTKSVLIPENKHSGTARPPANLSVRTTEKEGKTIAILKWQSRASTDAAVQGYVLYIDYSSPGFPVRMGSLPLLIEGEFEYSLPDPERDSYIFRLAAMDSDRKIGPYSEVTLNLRNR